MENKTEINERFKNWKKPDMDKEGWSIYGWRCQNPQNLYLGERIDIGCFTYLNAFRTICIDDDTQIGSHCSIYSYDSENNKTGEVKIGKACLIGSHSIILPGSIIPGNTKIKAYTLIMERDGETCYKETTDKSWRLLNPGGRI